MNKFVWVVTLCFFAYTVSAKNSAPDRHRSKLNKVLKEIAASPDFKTAGFAFYAIDLSTGESLAAHNEYMVLKPASTLKLFSTATALETLGPDYRFETALEYSGTIDTEKHVLNGNIIIHGGGDPTLGSKYFEETKDHQFLAEWSRQIQTLGIDSISGRIVGDASYYSYFTPVTWSWNDMGNYYGAAPSGLTIFDNYYTLYFNTGSYGDTAVLLKVEPEIPEMHFENLVTGDSISYDNSYIYGAPYASYRLLRGELPIHKAGFEVKGSMPDPALIAAHSLATVLKQNGVNIAQPSTTAKLQRDQNAKTKPAVTSICKTLSPPLSEIIEQTNVHSINLFAEHCLLQAGVAMDSAQETEIAAERMMTFWKNRGLPTEGMQVYDGSGLSHYNAVSPVHMVSLLKYMKTQSENYEAYYNSMAVAGKTGTLKNMFHGSLAEGNLRAKSGTINKVKAYAGYVRSVSGREIAFSVTVNNFTCSSGEATRKLEQLLTALAEYKK